MVVGEEGTWALAPISNSSFSWGSDEWRAWGCTRWLVLWPGWFKWERSSSWAWSLQRNGIKTIAKLGTRNLHAAKGRAVRASTVSLATEASRRVQGKVREHDWVSVNMIEWVWAGLEPCLARFAYGPGLSFPAPPRWAVHWGLGGF